MAWILLNYCFKNTNFNSLFEGLSIRDFFVHSLDNFLMCLCISFKALKILKFSLSELILINSQLSSFFIAFLFKVLKILKFSLSELILIKSQRSYFLLLFVFLFRG